MAFTAGHGSALTLIRRGSFARFWWAGFIGSIGDWITIFATLAVADRIAGGPGTLVAIVSRVLPGLLFGAVAGAVADRFDRKRLIFIADFGRGLLVPFLAFATDLWVLVGINFALEFLSILGQSPRAAILPRLVKSGDIVPANSLMMGAAYGTIPVGAAFNWALDAAPALTLGGWVPDANTDFALAFFVDALTFFVSAVIVATLPTMSTALGRRRKGQGHAIRTTLSDMGAGVRFLWTTRSVRRVIGGMTTALFGGGTVIILGLDFVEMVLNADTEGFFAVVTALGVGAALGIFVVSLYAHRLVRRDVVFGFATALTGTGLAAAALTSTVAGASAWLFVMGLGAGAAYVMGLSHLHEEVSDEMRGRVFAALFALMRIGLFVSMGIAVPLAGALQRARLPGILSQPTRTVLAAGGVTILLAGLGILWSIRDVFGAPKLGADTRGVLEEAARATRRGGRFLPNGESGRRGPKEDLGESEDLDRPAVGDEHVAGSDADETTSSSEA
jgi:dTMP kinase